MADSKITALDNLTSADPANDMIPIVDVSATPPASGNTKRISINNLLACSPSATLASATITGALGAAGLNVTGATIPSNGVYLSAANNLAFSTGGSNRVTIDSGGTIGVGIAAPFADAGYKAIDLRGTTGGEVVLGSTSVREATITGDATNGMTLNTVNATPLRFFVQGVERAQFNTTGNLAFANGKGIDFSAVTGGSGTATGNVLNDYEEGTWTGTITGTVTPATPVTGTGRYTKIGRQVNVQIWFFNVDTTGYSGEVIVTGLPFANASGNTAVPGSVGSSLIANFTGTLISQIGTGATGFELYSVSSGGAMTNATHNAGAARRLALSSTYQTA